MEKIEAYLQKNTNITMQAYIDHNTAYIVGLYDNDRGNRVAMGHGSTLLESMQQAVTQAEKVS